MTQWEVSSRQDSAILAASWVANHGTRFSSSACSQTSHMTSHVCCIALEPQHLNSSTKKGATAEDKMYMSSFSLNILSIKCKS